MRLSVIIPVYNEEQTIHEVLERVAAVDLGGGIEMEIVIANDGSTDGTRRAIDERRLPANLPVHVHHSPINMRSVDRAGRARSTSRDSARGQSSRTATTTKHCATSNAIR